MDDMMGFIVKVTTRGSEPVLYSCGNQKFILHPGAEIIGYHYSMTGLLEGGSFSIANVIPFTLVDPVKKLYTRGDALAFKIDTIDMKIFALRGPASNNIYMPEKYKKLDMWHEQIIEPAHQ